MTGDIQKPPPPPRSPHPIIPPDILSNEDIDTMRSIRKDIWTNAFYGFCMGSLGGFISHTAYTKYKTSTSEEYRRFLQNSRYHSKNTLMGSIFVGGALGSFLLASTTGKNQVHQLHPIMDIGKADRNMKEEEEFDNSPLIENRRKAVAITKRVTSPGELERNRLMRRTSLANSLTTGHGLSDSHGGHWVHDEDDKTKFTKG